MSNEILAYIVINNDIYNGFILEFQYSIRVLGPNSEANFFDNWHNEQTFSVFWTFISVLSVSFIGTPETRR